MRIKLDLDEEMTEKLMESAMNECRPVGWQAYVLLRRALGLPFPSDDTDRGSPAMDQPVAKKPNQGRQEREAT